MRTAAKVDANQPEIVAALRRVGATVQPLHAVGRGCPDLCVGWRGATFLLEVKDGAKAPSKRKLTDDQVDWHDGWKGQVAVVCSVEEALAAIGANVTRTGPERIGCVTARLLNETARKRVTTRAGLTETQANGVQGMAQARNTKSGRLAQ